MVDVVFIVLAAGIILAVVAGQAILLSRSEKSSPAAPVAAAPAAASGTDLYSRLIDGLRRRRWARRSLSLASLAAVLVAVGIIGFPFYTNLVQSRIQSRLDNQLASPALRDAYIQRRVAEGDSLTRIKIPALDVDVVVVEGIGADALRAGAGHYRSSPLPCEIGNVAIAGHRTTYGRPFANLDLLDVGAEITLETPIGACTYHVSAAPEGRRALDERNASFVVEPTELGVVGPSTTGMLTLTTCHPKGSAAERLIIQAELVTAPHGSAGAVAGT